MTLARFAVGCSSTQLTDDERAFFRAARPCGLILFGRNCESPDQVRRLAEAAAEAVGGGSFLVLVDQEGGRVRRLRPPGWRDYPSAQAFGRLYALDPETGVQAAGAAARLAAEELRATGITVNCAPVLDVPAPGAHGVIGDRAYADDPDAVIALGRAVAEGFMAGGVIPVMKHVPGHGRARADSHATLPAIEASMDELERKDFRPFAALAGLPAAMTAHVLLKAVDPGRPASVSPVIIERVIRGMIGFDGLLMSDDVNMQALAGPLAARVSGVIGAGCDIALHCSGDLREMEQVAEVVPELAGTSLARFETAMAVTRRSEPFDAERAEAMLARAAQEETARA